MSKEEAFVTELIGYIFAYPNDDYMTMECLCRKLHKHGLIDKKNGEWTCNFIEQAPTVDAVEVVRCRECSKRMTDDCPMCNECGKKAYPTADDEFCSYGEREGE